MSHLFNKWHLNNLTESESAQMSSLAINGESLIDIILCIWILKFLEHPLDLLTIKDYTSSAWWQNSWNGNKSIFIQVSYTIIL